MFKTKAGLYYRDIRRDGRWEIWSYIKIRKQFPGGNSAPENTWLDNLLVSTLDHNKNSACFMKDKSCHNPQQHGKSRVGVVRLGVI